jgi:hypothetical protein
MVSSGANVIIWCYYVMLSSGMITHPFFIFPENFTHSTVYRGINDTSGIDGEFAASVVDTGGVP